MKNIFFVLLLLSAITKLYLTYVKKDKSIKYSSYLSILISVFLLAYVFS